MQTPFTEYMAKTTSATTTVVVKHPGVRPQHHLCNVMLHEVAVVVVTKLDVQGLIGTRTIQVYCVCTQQYGV